MRKKKDYFHQEKKMQLLQRIFPFYTKTKSNGFIYFYYFYCLVNSLKELNRKIKKKEKKAEHTLNQTHKHTRRNKLIDLID